MSRHHNIWYLVSVPGRIGLSGIDIARRLSRPRGSRASCLGSSLHHLQRLFDGLGGTSLYGCFTLKWIRLTLKRIHLPCPSFQWLQLAIRRTWRSGCRWTAPWLFYRWVCVYFKREEEVSPTGIWSGRRGRGRPYTSGGGSRRRPSEPPCWSSSGRSPPFSAKFPPFFCL